MDGLEALVGGHPVIFVMVVAGGLALVLLPLAMYLLDRRARKNQPPDR